MKPGMFFNGALLLLAAVLVVWIIAWPHGHTRTPINVLVVCSNGHRALIAGYWQHNRFQIVHLNGRCP